MLKKLFLVIIPTLLLFYSSTLTSFAATFDCAYDGTNCQKATGSFCPGIPDSDLVSFCIPKNSLDCDGNYDCAAVGAPTSTPNPGGPTSTLIPPSPIPKQCSSLGSLWSCQPASSLGSLNCNATNPSSCNPNNPSSCMGSHPNTYDVACGPNWFCCGPALAGSFMPTPTPVLPPFFCDGSGNATPDLTPRIDTGLGCIPYSAGNFTAKALGWGAVTNIGIALIIISISVIMFLTSAGDTKKIQSAKELFFSALGGIFLIAICVVLLNYLGVNILHLQSIGFKVSV